MKVDLKRCFVEFNNCPFGIAAGAPRFLIDPASFTVEPDGGCAIEEASSVTVQLELEMLDEAFAMMLDRNGCPVRLDPAVFRQRGTLYLEEFSESGEATGNLFRLRGAMLEERIRYVDFAERGRRLVLNFCISEPVDGKYIELMGVPRPQ